MRRWKFRSAQKASLSIGKLKLLSLIRLIHKSATLNQLRESVSKVVALSHASQSLKVPLPRCLMITPMVRSALKMIMAMKVTMIWWWMVTLTAVLKILRCHSKINRAPFIMRTTMVRMICTDLKKNKTTTVTNLTKLGMISSTNTSTNKRVKCSTKASTKFTMISSEFWQVSELKCLKRPFLTSPSSSSWTHWMLIASTIWCTAYAST